MAGIAKKRAPSRGFTLVELLIVIVVIAILASLSLPNMIQSRMAANETSAIGSLRVIAKSMEIYHVKGMGGATSYPANYRDLGTMTAPELDSLLTTGEKSGYVFSGGGNAANYAITAVPIRYGTSGRRSFFIDATGVLRFSENNGAAATATDPAIQ